MMHVNSVNFLFGVNAFSASITMPSQTNISEISRSSRSGSLVRVDTSFPVGLYNFLHLMRDVLNHSFNYGNFRSDGVSDSHSKQAWCGPLCPGGSWQIASHPSPDSFSDTNSNSPHAFICNPSVVAVQAFEHRERDRSDLNQFRA